MKRAALCMPLFLLLATGAVLGESEPTPDTLAGEPAPVSGEAEPEATEPQADTGPKRINGMSILGNQEAPTSLVIVPWKSSEIGDSLGISTLLDDSRLPIDREVFLRALSYYEIQTETTP
jgi:hypothetical protein